MSELISHKFHSFGTCVLLQWQSWREVNPGWSVGCKECVDWKKWKWCVLDNIFHSKKVPSDIVSICNSVLIWTAKSHWVLIMSSTDVMDQTSPRYDQQQQQHSSPTAATATTQTSSAEPGAVLQPGPASSVIIGGKFVINNNKPIWRR